MKKSGISRRIDKLGRITIPMEMRNNLGICTGDMIDIDADGDGIVLSKSADIAPREKLMGAISVIDECSSLTDSIDAETARLVKTKLGELKNLINISSADTEN